MRTLILLTFLLGLSACSQLTRMQPARTIGKDNLAIGGTLSAYGADTEDDDLFDVVVLPYLTFDATFGLTNKIDLKGSLSSGGNILVSPKFLLSNPSSPFAIALEPGYEYQSGINDESGISRLHGSAIFSYYFSESNSLSFEPKWISQFDDNNTYFFGGSGFYSFPLNDKLQMSASLSLFQVSNTSANANSDTIFSGGVGFQFLID